MHSEDFGTFSIVWDGEQRANAVCERHDNVAGTIRQQTLELFVLAQFRAGIDICSAEYLESLADMQKLISEDQSQPSELFIIMQGGICQEVVANDSDKELLADVSVTVIDYDEKDTDDFGDNIKLVTTGERRTTNKAYCQGMAVTFATQPISICD